MKLYIAGPMRGHSEFNFPAFREAADILRDGGHSVISPVELDENIRGFDGVGMTGKEDLNDLGFDVAEALADDTRAILDKATDGVVVLDGWAHSVGACAEVALAHALGKPIYELAAVATAEWGHELRTIEPLLATVTEGWHDVTSKTEVRTTSATGGQKGTKLARFDLVPPGPLTAVAEHYGKGAEKYEARNWEKGYEWSKSFAALMRHAWAYWGGEDIDPETGSHHLAAVCFHALGQMEWARTHPEFDDRPKDEKSVYTVARKPWDFPLPPPSPFSPIFSPSSKDLREMETDEALQRERLLFDHDDAERERLWREKLAKR